MQPRKPLKLHAIQGTLKKSRHRDRQDFAPASELPQKPEWLSEAASREWDRIVQHPQIGRTLLSVDGALLSVYCELLSETEAHTRTNVEVNSSRLLLLAKLSSKFGLNPVDRQRMNLPPVPRKTAFADLKRRDEE